MVHQSVGTMAGASICSHLMIVIVSVILNWSSSLGCYFKFLDCVDNYDPSFLAVKHNHLASTLQSTIISNTTNEKSSMVASPIYRTGLQRTVTEPLDWWLFHQLIPDGLGETMCHLCLPIKHNLLMCLLALYIQYYMSSLSTVLTPLW